MVDLMASEYSDFETATAILPPITCLVSTATSFVALTDDGNVLSWGSALHPQLLGRAPATISPAHSPKLVSSLEGILIQKIAAGGWIGAALSRSGDLVRTFPSSFFPLYKIFYIVCQLLHDMRNRVLPRRLAALEPDIYKANPVSKPHSIYGVNNQETSISIAYRHGAWKKM